MAYSNGILLGRITKVSGFEGAVTVKLERFFSEELPNMESVFLEVEGRPVPFFTDYYEYAGADILKLKFEGYDSPEKVEEFVGCKVHLTTPGVSGPQDDPDSLTGYTVISADKKIIGRITEIIENPGQSLLNVVTPSDKAILIPLHEDLIVSIDRESNQLIMALPEGLEDIN